MNNRKLVSGSVRILARYRMRSFFMSLGIVVGVAALVVMRSMGSGAEQQMLDRMERMFSAGSIVIVNTGAHRRGGFQTRGRLSIEDLEVIADRVDTVIDWNPSLTAGDQEVRYGDRTLSLMVRGQSERGQFVSGRGVTEGEYFSAADVRSTARVALLGFKTAEALFDGENPIGKQIRIGTAPFRVKGVLAPHGIDPHGLDRDDEVHVPITTMMRRLRNEDTIGSAKLLVERPDLVDDAVDRVAEILVERHALGPDDPEDFSIYTPTQVQQAIKKANRVLTVFLPATAGIALLVAAIVIANIMLIGVRERVPEIGLRKAVGATNRQISAQFLLESLAITAISGVLGVGIGAGVLTAVARTVKPETTIAPDSIVLGLAAALIVGLLAGLLPAQRAARLEPVDALR